jgi:uncharacterized membrane protein
MATLTPVIAIHVTAAILATVTGPLALWGRLGSTQRPRLHRAFGYSWVTLMLITAVSAMFIKGTVGPLWQGFSWIHLLVPVVLLGLFGAFWFLFRGNVRGHRRVMVNLYIGACLVSGGFTLMPGRLLGNVVFGT